MTEQPQGFTQDHDFLICPHCRWPHPNPMEVATSHQWHDVTCDRCGEAFQACFAMVMTFYGRRKQPDQKE